MRIKPCLLSYSHQLLAFLVNLVLTISQSAHDESLCAMAIKHLCPKSTRWRLSFCRCAPQSHIFHCGFSITKTPIMAKCSSVVSLKLGILYNVNYCINMRRTMMSFMIMIIRNKVMSSNSSSGGGGNNNISGRSSSSSSSNCWDR